jgi:hypothetical protein
MLAGRSCGRYNRRPGRRVEPGDSSESRSGAMRLGLRKNLKKLLKKRKKWHADFFLLSYPKCGRTWLTLQVGRAIQQHFGLSVPNLLKLSQMADACPDVPSIRVTHDRAPHRKRPDELPALKNEYAGRKVVFMVRDPRDVIVSYYFHKTKREKARTFWFFQRKRRETHSPFTGSLSEFLRVEIGGFDTLLRYYNIWAESKQLTDGFLLVRYEDMHEDPERELRRVVDFLGLAAITDDEVRAAVEFAAFDNMRKMEAAEGTGSYKLAPADRSDEESFKVRKGKVGGYVEYLSADDIEFLNHKMAQTLSDFYGYEPCVTSST